MALLVRNLVERRVPHSIALYMGVSWGCVQFTHFAVNEFLLSPHWTRVVLSTVLLFLPTVLMLAWFHGRPGRNRMTLTEKVGIPVNLIVAAVILALAFSGTDLGTAVTRVTVENEEGEIVERAIPKAEFRKRTAIFPFDIGPGLGENDAWMSLVASEALAFDLLPDDFFDPVGNESLVNHLLEAGFDEPRNVPLALKREAAEEHYAEFLVSGVLDRAGDLYEVTLSVHDVDGGSLIDEHRHEGADLLALIDELAVDLKATLDIPPRDWIEDLPVRERLTADDAALEAFGRALRARFVDSDFGATRDHLRNATSMDATFACAQWRLGVALRDNNQPQEARAALRAALDHSYRLPERIQTLETLRELTPRNASHLKRLAAIHRQLGNTTEALATLGQYVKQFPEDYTGYTALAAVYRSAGEYGHARENLDRAMLMEPDSVDVVRALARVDLNVGRFTDARAGYERALSLARTPGERAAGHAGLRDYYGFRGEMTSAIDAMQARVAEMSTYVSPLLLAQSQGRDILIYISADRGDEALALVEDLKAQLQPPVATYHRPHLDFHLAVELKDLPAARDAHQRMLLAVDELGLETVAHLMDDRGRIEELASDHAAALVNYRDGMEREPSSGRQRAIGRILRALGRLDEAEAGLREALRLSPASPLSHLEMAHVLERKSDLPGAVEHLRAALRAWENADGNFQPARDAREKLAELGG